MNILGSVGAYLLKFFDTKKTLIGALQLALPVLLAKYPQFADQIGPIADFINANLNEWVASGTIVLSIGLVMKGLKLLLALLIKMFPDVGVLVTIEKLVSPRGAEVRALKANQ